MFTKCLFHVMLWDTDPLLKELTVSLVGKGDKYTGDHRHT